MIGTRREVFLKGFWTLSQRRVRTQLKYSASQHPLTETLTSLEKTAINFYHPC